MRANNSGLKIRDWLPFQRHVLNLDPHFALMVSVVPCNQ